MTVLKSITRDWSVMADGTLLRGDVDKCNLPEIVRETEKYRGGGMDRAILIELGFKEMELMFEMTSMDENVQSLAAITVNNRRLFKVFGYTVGYDGTQSGFTDECQGMIHKLDKIDLEAGKKVKVKATVSVDWYRRTVNDVVTMYSDPLNLILMVNGVDMYATRRARLGM